MKLNGWKRLFLVYSVVAALGSYVLAFEQVREIKIARDNEIESFQKSNNADARMSHCYPIDKEPVCRHDMSFVTKSSLKRLESYNEELDYAFPKYFLIFFGLSTIICYVILFLFSKYLLVI